MLIMFSSASDEMTPRKTGDWLCENEYVFMKSMRKIEIFLTLFIKFTI